MKFKVEYMGLSDSLFTKGQVYEFDDENLSISVTRLMKDFVIVEEDVNDDKTGFRVGDDVYFITGVGYLMKAMIMGINYELRYPILVTDKYDITYSFTLDGKYRNDVDAVKTLSFTPYDLINGGFSQNREDIGKDLRNNSTIDVGDWGYFWDNDDLEHVVYNRLLQIEHGIGFVYHCHRARWDNFSKSIPPHIKEMMKMNS